jgi:condensin-2 complex subunit D3
MQLSKSSNEAGTANWSDQLLAACENAIAQYLSLNNANHLVSMTGAISAVLFSLGEISMIGMDDVPPGAGAAATTDVERRVGDGSKIVIPSRLVTLVQALMAPSVLPGIGMSVTDMDATFDNSPASPSIPLPEAVRAHAYIALGKLCLRDANLAKSYVKALVRDLGPASTAPAAVRNNALFVLGDLCVRYTSLVDRHVGTMAGAVADPSPLVSNYMLLLLQLT